MRHRVTGPVEVSEKPDILWDKPHLERLYARLEDEYELKERAESLNRKLAVIAETAQVLTDIIDTRRSLRLEVIIVLLILFEVIITIYQLAVGRHALSRLSSRPSEARAGTHNHRRVLCEGCSSSPA